MGLEKTRSINAGNIFILSNIIFLGFFSFLLINFPMQDAAAGGSEPAIGEISWTATNFAPRGTANCDGQLLPINQQQSFFSLFGTTYGGDGRTTFGLPELRGRAPLDDGSGPGLSPRSLGQKSGSQSVTLTNQNIPSHTHTLQASSTDGGQVNPTDHVLGTGTHPFTHRIYSDQNAATPLDNKALDSSGGGQQHNNMNPFLTIRCLINLVGIFLTEGSGGLSSPILGEIRYVGFNFAPAGWAKCEGQLLPIASNSALFSLFGTTYGGDGRTTFGIPDMRDRMPIHTGTGPSLTPRSQGSTGGAETVTLTTVQLPSHTHTVQAFDGTGDNTDPTNRAMHKGSHPFLHRIFNTQNPDVDMSSSAVTLTGGGQSHNNMPPYLTINCMVAKTGVFPSRN